jgi:hypothetical protein
MKTIRITEGSQCVFAGKICWFPTTDTAGGGNALQCSCWHG